MEEEEAAVSSAGAAGVTAAAGGRRDVRREGGWPGCGGIAAMQTHAKSVR